MRWRSRWPLKPAGTRLPSSATRNNCQRRLLNDPCRFLETDRQVFCPDMAGRGRGDWLASPADYDYPQYLSDLMALIARTGGEKIDCLGTSMGGIIGMLLRRRRIRRSAASSSTSTDSSTIRILTRRRDIFPSPLFQRRQGIIKASLAFAGVEGAQCIVHRLLSPEKHETIASNLLALDKRRKKNGIAPGTSV
jgi:pimeloyl-ACP methyl ester carboxylesterase